MLKGIIAKYYYLNINYNHINQKIVFVFPTLPKMANIVSICLNKFRNYGNFSFDI